MDCLNRKNPSMDISKTISDNLSAWMDESSSLNTLKKLEAKSGVGFGTIQRAKNGDGNITVEKLAMLAAAFGRTPADLLTPAQTSTDLSLSSNTQGIADAAKSPSAPREPGWPFPYASEKAYRSLNDRGQVWIQGYLSSALKEACGNTDFITPVAPDRKAAG